MMKRFASGDDSVDILKEREAILSLLSQTAPMVLQKDIASYTINPCTRYYNVKLLPLPEVSHLLDTEKLKLNPVTQSCHMEAHCTSDDG